MASQNHDFIVSAIAGSIRKGGFDITYLDGRYKNVSKTKFEIPPKIINHRPDVVGKKSTGTFCVGEAKTTSDLASGRTAKQIRDFLSLVCTNPENRLFIGVPSSAKMALEKLLSELGFKEHPQLTVICVPDILLPDNEEL